MLPIIYSQNKTTLCFKDLSTDVMRVVIEFAGPEASLTCKNTYLWCNNFSNKDQGKLKKLLNTAREVHKLTNNHLFTDQPTLNEKQFCLPKEFVQHVERFIYPKTFDDKHLARKYFHERNIKEERLVDIFETWMMGAISDLEMEGRLPFQQKFAHLYKSSLQYIPIFSRNVTIVPEAYDNEHPFHLKFLGKEDETYPQFVFTYLHGIDFERNVIKLDDNHHLSIPPKYDCEHQELLITPTPPTYSKINSCFKHLIKKYRAEKELAVKHSSAIPLQKAAEYSLLADMVKNRSFIKEENWTQKLEERMERIIPGYKDSPSIQWKHLTA